MVSIVPLITSGDILKITWSGGNGPHYYIALVEETEIKVCSPYSLVKGLNDMDNYIELSGEKTLHKIEVMKP